METSAPLIDKWPLSRYERATANLCSPITGFAATTERRDRFTCLPAGTIRALLLHNHFRLDRKRLQRQDRSISTSVAFLQRFSLYYLCFLSAAFQSRTSPTDAVQRGGGAKVPSGLSSAVGQLQPALSRQNLTAVIDIIAVWWVGGITCERWAGNAGGGVRCWGWD